MQPAGELAAFVGGFVAAEGTFVASGRGFTFAVGLGAADSSMCELLAAWFGVGNIQHSPRRKPHYDDEVAFAVRKLRHLVEVVVPFMDEHLPPSYKRQQYLVWRALLLEYWDAGAKRRRPCTVDGCDEPQRAKGVCRRHYYRQYGG